MGSVSTGHETIRMRVFPLYAKPADLSGMRHPCSSRDVIRSLVMEIDRLYDLHVLILSSGFKRPPGTMSLSSLPRSPIEHFSLSPQRTRLCLMNGLTIPPRPSIRGQFNSTTISLSLCQSVVPLCIGQVALTMIHNMSQLKRTSPQLRSQDNLHEVAAAFFAFIHPLIDQQHHFSVQFQSPLLPTRPTTEPQQTTQHNGGN